MKIFTVLFILLLFGCDNSENESTAERNANTGDTLNQAPKNTLSIKPQKPKSDLDPAQAKVEGRIIKVIPQDDSMGNLNLVIAKVRGRARTTPAIANNDTLEVRVHNIGNYKEGDDITAIIQYNLSTKEAASQPAWSLVKQES